MDSQASLVGHVAPEVSAEPSRLVLPPDHYIVPCRYAKLPSMDVLKKTFTGGVSGIFDGREWDKYSLCINASEVPGDRIMLRKRFDRRMKSEEAIAWGNDYRTEFAPNGYRPAMGHHEVPDFHYANPLLCKEGWHVGLGSFAFIVGGHRSVAVLDAFGVGPILDGYWFDGGGWDPGSWFLFVRKSLHVFSNTLFHIISNGGCFFMYVCVSLPLLIRPYFDIIPS